MRNMSFTPEEELDEELRPAPAPQEVPDNDDSDLWADSPDEFEDDDLDEDDEEEWDEQFEDDDDLDDEDFDEDDEV